MAASVADIAAVKALVWGRGAPVPMAYTDAVIASFIERYPLANFIQTRPTVDAFPGVTAYGDYYVTSSEPGWVPTYERNLAAADILEELDGAIVAGSSTAVSSGGIKRMTVQGMTVDLGGASSSSGGYVSRADALRHRARRQAVTIGL